MLIERKEFLERMEECLAGVMCGSGHLMFVVGEAGIGKTSLLKEFVCRTGATVRVRSAVCEDFSTPEPLVLVRELCPEIDVSGSRSRYATFAAAFDLLRSEPSLLAIEDIHWADDASLDFLRFIGRRLAEQPILAIVTCRDEDEESRSKLSRALNDISPDCRSRLDLPRLSSNGVRDLALQAGLFGTPVYELTGGNPLYVAELIAARGASSSSLSDLVLSRMSRLSNAAKEVLRQLSVIPGRPSNAVLEALALDPAHVQECVAAGLLVHADDGLGFRHELSRRAVEESLLPAERRRLHTKALAVKKDFCGSASRLLHHAVAADLAEDIISLAPRAAAESSSAGDHRDAAAALRKLTEYEALLAPAEAAQTWRKLAFEVHVLGQIDEAIQYASRALEIANAMSDLTLAGELKTFLSRLFYLSGDRNTSMEWGDRAVATLITRGPGPALAMAYANLAQLSMLADQTEPAQSFAEQAISLAERFGRMDIVAHALNSTAGALQYVDPERAREIHDRAFELALASNDDAEVARVYNNRLWASAGIWDLRKAMAEAAVGITYCRERDLDLWRTYISGVKAWVELAGGSYDAAERSAEDALADPKAPLLARHPAILALSALNVRRGEPVDDLLNEMGSHLANCAEPGRRIPHALLLAERAWINGEGTSEALSAIDDVSASFPNQGNIFFAGAIIYWQAKLQGQPMPLDVRNVAEPYQRLSEGDWRQAAELWRAIGAPYERALALLEGDEAAAAEAVHLLETIGARGAASRARLDLTRRGIRLTARGPRASTRSNRFGVTRREVEVLKQLEEGLSNRQIGDRLFVSPKTVDHHVSSIIGKLGAKTRKEAVTLALREGLI